MQQKKENSDEQTIKRMADLLRQGLTLTELACPACASPLFRLKSGELRCAKCEKKVIVVKDEGEIAKITSAAALENLEKTLLAKIQEAQSKMQQETNVDELQKLGATLSELLESLEKIKKTRRVLGES